MAPISVANLKADIRMADNPAYDSATPEVPPTVERPIPNGLHKVISNPGAPRATKAPGKERPAGSEQSPDNRSVLQQHVDYWDFDRDGKIYPWDTYRGFHNIGFPAPLAFIAIFIIHLSFSWWSQDSWLPDPFFSILTKNIHRTRHGSDSQVYDSEGRFVPEKFEELFTKFDKDHKGGLTLWEMVDMGKTSRKVMDPFGWSAMVFEWGATYYVAHNKHGYVEKESIRRIYDGTLFPYLEDKYRSKRS